MAKIISSTCPATDDVFAHHRRANAEELKDYGACGESPLGAS